MGLSSEKVPLAPDVRFTASSESQGNMKIPRPPKECIFVGFMYLKTYQKAYLGGPGIHFFCKKIRENFDVFPFEKLQNIRNRWLPTSSAARLPRQKLSTTQVECSIPRETKAAEDVGRSEKPRLALRTSGKKVAVTLWKVNT